MPTRPRKRSTPAALGGSLALLLAVTACGERASLSVFPQPSNILLITIDTLRADHLSAYGYERETSPVLDRLAAEGVRFDRAAVQWPKTGPSFASIFTATYPKDNGIVRKIGIPLPEEYELLAETLSARGYSTAAVVANGAVGSEFNFDQGFDRYVQTWKIELPEGQPPNVATRVTDEALAVAAGLPGDRPWFLWVHYLDPHFPYTPPEPFAGRFVGDAHHDPEVPLPIDRRRRQRQMGAVGTAKLLDGRSDLGYYLARYDEEIAYADAEVGRLLDGLRATGRLDATLTAVTSDHGESLGEHRYFFDHGRFSFQTCLRVPLIVHYPGVLEPRVDTDPVELIHLAPTLLEAAGVPLADGAWRQGRSLLPRLLGEEPDAAERLAFSEAGLGSDGGWQRIVQTRRYKLIHVPGVDSQQWIDGRGRPWVLYDLANDPAETENLFATEREEGRRLRRILLDWRDAEPFDLGLEGRVADERGDMDAETRKQLEALGYIQ